MNFCQHSFLWSDDVSCQCPAFFPKILNWILMSCRNSHTRVWLKGSARDHSDFMLLILPLRFLTILILVSTSDFLTEDLATCALIKHISSHGTIKVFIRKNCPAGKRTHTVSVWCASTLFTEPMLKKPKIKSVTVCLKKKLSHLMDWDTKVLFLPIILNTQQLSWSLIRIHEAAKPEEDYWSYERCSNTRRRRQGLQKETTGASRGSQSNDASPGVQLAGSWLQETRSIFSSTDQELESLGTTAPCWASIFLYLELLRTPSWSLSTTF